MAERNFLNVRPTERPRVLICGSREWTDPDPIRAAIGGVRDIFLGCKVTVIHGAARGADNIANSVAASIGCHVEAFPADWRGQGKAAGHIRNKLMLDSKPHVVFAFKDGFDYTLSRGGTENMVKIAREANVPTYVVSH